MLPIANEEQGPGEAAMNGERCLMQLAIDETTVQLLDEGLEIKREGDARVTTGRVGFTSGSLV